MSEAQNIPVFDGHNDTILDLYLPHRGGNRSFFERGDRGHIDLPRAQAGGLGGGFFALFTPTDRLAGDTAGEAGVEASCAGAQARALQFTMGMAAMLFRLEKEAGGQVKIVRTVDELAGCLDSGTFAMLFHIEGAEAIDTDLEALEVLYQAGLRSIGITWSRTNAFGAGVPFRFYQGPDTGPGLSAAGKELVRACNRLGILVDVSHLNEKGFWDVERTSSAPMVATHSGAFALAPATRNLTNKQLDAIRASEGVVGVNFHVGFLRTDGRTEAETSLREIVRHVNYMVERMGIDHVALGSDFDGATMPGDLRDAAGLPKLLAALRDHGYDEPDLRKIAHENWQRVLGKIWRS